MKKLLVMLCMLTCVFGLTACDGEQTLRESDVTNIQKAELISVNMAIPYLSTFGDDEMADYYLEEYNKDEMQYVAESMFYTFLTAYGSEMQNAGVNYVYVDGVAFMSGITSFNGTMPVIGEIKEVGDPTSVVKGDEIVVTVPIIGTNGEATAEFIYDNDIFLTMIAAALNPNETMGDLMVKAALNTLMGMGTVFAVLIVIIIIISALGIIPKLQNKTKGEKVQEAPKVKDIKATSVDNAIAQIAAKEELAGGLDVELAIVLTAAIAAYEESQAPSDGFVARSVRKIRR